MGIELKLKGFQQFGQRGNFHSVGGHDDLNGDLDAIKLKILSLQDKIDPEVYLEWEKRVKTDLLEVPIGPIIRARAKKLKKALNGLVQNKWSKMNLEGFGTFKEHEGQPIIHLIQIQEEPNSCGTRG